MYMVGRIMVAHRCPYLDTRTLHGKIDFVDMIKTIDLKMGRLSWIIGRYPVYSGASLKLETLSQQWSESDETEVLGEIQREDSTHCCWLWKWKEGATSQGMWWPLEVGNSLQFITSNKMGTSFPQMQETEFYQQP